MNKPPVVVMPPAGGCVGDWRGWCLDTHCGCCITSWSIDRMIERRRLPTWQLLSAAIARMRCRHCGERVHHATLRDDRRRRASGMPHRRMGILVPVLEDLLQG